MSYFVSTAEVYTPEVEDAAGALVELPAFSEYTAYAGDYQWFPFLETVSWERSTEGGIELMDGLKGRWDAPNVLDVQTVGGGIGLSKEGPVYVTVWQVRPADQDYDDDSLEMTFNPKPGDRLIRNDANEDAGHASRWLIVDATRRPFKGQWELICDREVANA